MNRFSRSDRWRCKADHSGSLVADLIELNVVNFFGVITGMESGGDKFEMFTNPNADPQSGYEKKKMTVVVDAEYSTPAPKRI